MFDIGIIIAVLGSAIAIIGVVISMMFWVRSEGNEIRREQKEDKKDILNLIRAIEIEMKDFHFKLLEIERNRK
jgi:Ca2+/Na+ antiporter